MIVRNAARRILERHSSRIGTRVQSAVQALIVYLLGPLLYVFVRLAFRVRVHGREAILSDPRRFATLWPWTLVRPHLHGIGRSDAWGSFR